MAHRVFMICPVRSSTDEDLVLGKAYVDELESRGVEVHWPPRDTEQLDETGGLRICRDNIAAIRSADEVHIWWDPASTGSKFDLGAAMALGKPIVLINDVKLPDLPKSFEHVVVALGNEDNPEYVCITDNTKFVDLEEGLEDDPEYQRIRAADRAIDRACIATLLEHGIALHKQAIRALAAALKYWELRDPDEPCGEFCKHLGDAVRLVVEQDWASIYLELGAVGDDDAALRPL